MHIVKYGGLDISSHVIGAPEYEAGFEFLSDFGISLNEISIVLPLEFRDIVKLYAELSVDDFFIGNVYDIVYDFGEREITLLGRHKIYELITAEQTIYSATGKNFVDIIRDIILLFLDAQYIDDLSFDLAKAFFSEYIGDITLTIDDTDAPLSIISTINQLLGIGMYVENNKIKIFVIPEAVSETGMLLRDDIIIKHGKVSHNFDFYKNKIVLKYSDGVDNELKAEYGSGASILEVDAGRLKFSSTVAETIAKRLYALYNKVYRTLEISLISEINVKIGQVITYNDWKFIIKNLQKSEGQLNITGIGGV